MSAVCLFLFLTLCVEWGSTNTGWPINVHHVKNLYTHKVWS